MMYPIQEISDVTLAFPADVLRLMPPYEEIPEEFKQFPGGKWNKLFSDWFYCGLTRLDLQPREGVDENKALRHIKAVMASFQPSHEHKEAAVAFLFNEWFSDGEWEKRSK
jgi:hypothetical protein